MKLVEESSFLGDEQWPPGFRFHPTDEELVLYYLKRKICRRRLKLDVIGEVDVYKCDPEELPGLSQLKSGDRQWFFFSPRDRKYPNGGRANRATKLGYWKATGKDRNITCNSRSVGIKKTLVFYKGRAPSGVRTDWVMHEYTLDEKELKRCPEAQDYYALYKLYKKSGPGPKNGEQYGAPFREEDWFDDDKVADVANTEEFTSDNQDSGHAPVDSTGTNFPAHSQINVLEELMNQIANDHLFEPDAVVCNTVPTDKETPGTLVNKCLLEANVQDMAIVFPQSWQQNDLDASFDPTHSVTFQGISEVTSVSSMNRLGSHDSEGDFLEINDLGGPDSNPQNIENPVDGLRFEDLDVLCELDVFRDASMFLQDVGATEPVSNIYMNNVESEIHNPVPNLYATDFDYGVVGDGSSVSFSNFQTEMSQPISHPHHQNLENEMGSQCSYQLRHNPNVASQHWVHDQNSNVAIQAESSQGSILPPASDLVYSGVNRNGSPTQYQSDKDNEVVNSWFSSTLWSFVESIPTTSASAAESTALVNKAFERLSSFGRRGSVMKLSSVNDTVANTGNTLSAHRRSGNRYSSKGLLLLSIVGVLCAILWMMRGAG